MDPQQIKNENMIEEKPPILKSWNQLYTIVFLNLVILVVLFYLFTEYFS
jgi:hypothetical protein